MKTTPLVMTLVLAAAGLVACGGGGGNDTPPPPPVADPLVQVPAAASQSAAGLLAYVRTLLGLSSASIDAAEPVGLDNFTGVPDDTGEPATLT